MKHNAVEGPQYKAVANKMKPPERVHVRNTGNRRTAFLINRLIFRVK